MSTPAALTDLRALLDRVTWRDRQRLTARDLGDAHHRAELLRWLHNRYLHGAAGENWGVVTGMHVAVAAGGSYVTVGAGCAIDVFGRELLVPVALVVGAPRLPGVAERVLVARRPEGDADPCAARRHPCSGAADGAAWDRAELAWRSAGDVVVGVEVPLAAVSLLKGKVQGKPDLAVRRFARSMARAKVVSGHTTAAQTNWIDRGDPHAPGHVVEARVTMRSAGFVRTPSLAVALAREGASAQSVGPPGCVLADSDADSFVVQVIPHLGPAVFADGAAAVEAAGWTVTWHGVEAAVGLPPTLSFLHLSGLVLSSLAALEENP